MSIDTRGRAAAQAVRDTYADVTFTVTPPGRGMPGPMRAVVAAVAAVAVGVGIYALMGWGRGGPGPTAQAVALSGPIEVTYDLTYERTPGSWTTGTFVWRFVSYSEWTWEQVCCGDDTGTAVRVTPDGVSWHRSGPSAEWQETGTFDPAEGMTPIPEFAAFDANLVEETGVPSDAPQADRVADLVGDLAGRAATYLLGSMQIVFDADSGLPVYAWDPTAEAPARELLAVSVVVPDSPIATDDTLPAAPMGMVWVGATNGRDGLAYAADLAAADESGQVTTPEEAVAYMQRLEAGLVAMPPPVPVYDDDVAAVIGYFGVVCEQCVHNPAIDRGPGGVVVMAAGFADNFDGGPPPGSEVVDEVATHPGLTGQAQVFFGAIDPIRPVFYNEHTGGSAVEMTLESDGATYSVEVFPSAPADEVFVFGANAAVRGIAAMLVDWGGGQYELTVAGRHHLYLVRNDPTADASAPVPVLTSIAGGLLAAYEETVTEHSLVDATAAFGLGDSAGGQPGPAAGSLPSSLLAAVQGIPQLAAVAGPVSPLNAPDTEWATVDLDLPDGRVGTVWYQASGVDLDEAAGSVAIRGTVGDLTTAFDRDGSYVTVHVGGPAGDVLQLGVPLIGATADNPNEFAGLPDDTFIDWAVQIYQQVNEG